MKIGYFFLQNPTSGQVREPAPVISIHVREWEGLAA